MESMSVSYTIKAVAHQTGLSVHTIRAWERRYAVLEPMRSATNRRLYSAEDVLRLKLLEGARREGHSIGRIASLTNDELQRIGNPRSMAKPYGARVGGEYLAAARQAILDMRGDELEETLVRAAAELGLGRMLDELIAPVMDFLDRGWEEGEVTIAMEHIASATIRSFLEHSRRDLSIASIGPVVAVTTPSGQHHELGALIVALCCALSSCRVAYLGPNLPAAEIARSALALGAKAVALSLVHPADDPKLGEEILEVVRRLGPNVRVWAGGRAAASYRKDIETAGAIWIADLHELRLAINRLV